MVNYSNRKYSVSAIFLMTLLVIRFIGQLFGLYLFPPIIVLVVLFSILALLYLVSFIGILMKTNWGLDVALAVTILDLTLSFINSVLTGGINASIVGGIITDIILLGLIFNIKSRINRIGNRSAQKIKDSSHLKPGFSPFQQKFEIIFIIIFSVLFVTYIIVSIISEEVPFNSLGGVTQGAIIGAMIGGIIGSIIYLVKKINSRRGKNLK